MEATEDEHWENVAPPICQMLLIKQNLADKILNEQASYNVQLLGSLHVGWFFSSNKPADLFDNMMF
jgi:hypothetical protein